jgi:abequosyltransferase
MQPLLSIVIPSNNRTELLNEAIHSILSEPGFEGWCELCISDNSSGQSTEQLVALKYAGTAEVVYRRSLDAPSQDENVNKVISFARGKYVWLFGDDDVIVPGFLLELINYLQTNSPDLLVVNSRSFRNKEIIEKLRVPKTNVRVYGPLEDNEFLEELGGYLTYLGGILIKKHLWCEYFRVEMVGTYFAHIDTVYRAKLGRSAHYFPQPGISMRLHTQTWTSRHFEIWNEFFPAVIWGLEGYSDKAKQAVIPLYPMKSIRRILASRAYGRFNLDVWRTVLIRSKVSNHMVRWTSLLIALLPRELFRLLYIFFIHIRRRKHAHSFSPELALSQLERTVK